MKQNFQISNQNEQPGYKQLLSKISATYTNGQIKATQAVNTELLETYWQIGQHIVEYKQGGNIRAEYGKQLISNLAKDLSLLHGRGSGRSNIIYMRLLFLRYPISQKPSHQLSWSDVIELLKIQQISGYRKMR